jgi:hypothetical protein
LFVILSFFLSLHCLPFFDNVFFFFLFLHTFLYIITTTHFKMIYAYSYHQAI